MINLVISVFCAFAVFAFIGATFPASSGVLFSATLFGFAMSMSYKLFAALAAFGLVSSRLQ